MDKLTYEDVMNAHKKMSDQYRPKVLILHQNTVDLGLEKGWLRKTETGAIYTQVPEYPFMSGIEVFGTQNIDEATKGFIYDRQNT